MTIPKALRIVSAAMLLIALLPFPYSFYVLLRWVVFITMLAAVYEIREKGGLMLVFFVASAIVFNPIIPFNLNRSVWQVIDLLCSITLLINLSRGRE